MAIKNMIEGLIALGYTQGSIAEAVGATQPTIHRALNGSDIRYTTGKAIELLYVLKVGDPTAELRGSAAPHKSAA
ncbi:Uncharacterised protein [Stutzerimonas stutzeri]|uniref:hypothetical protein n=1 Tax=Stutzerimonas stutzeri subgroup TaxID=578833 RepID=UPI000C6EE19B|nr:MULTISPECIES: hypothetical protein [Stutzerimonas stutzeri subgroup]MCQ2048800.1 hypothetical protein [Stutzerimonas kunmingensis]PKR27117.1 hypothetical protein CXK90_12840 [Stutzerimonas stutzeri]QQC13211.1 hypothetical protein I6I22_10555 [Stutzerimonas stutzeri]VEI35378.1 Uncharacterised protein [Stutzerimonas stutzeri]